MADGPEVLIVEDDVYQARWFAETLARAGYAVRGPAADELSALQLIGENPPDAAVLDIDLSGPLGPSHGLTRTSAQIAAALADWGVPMVVVTSHPGIGFLPPVHPVVRLRKPVREDELLAALRLCVERSRSARDAADPRSG